MTMTSTYDKGLNPLFIQPCSLQYLRVVCRNKCNQEATVKMAFSPGHYRAGSGK